MEKTVFDSPFNDQKLVVYGFSEEELEKLREIGRKQADACKKAKRKENIKFVLALVMTVALVYVMVLLKMIAV